MWLACVTISYLLVCVYTAQHVKPKPNLLVYAIIEWVGVAIAAIQTAVVYVIYVGSPDSWINHSSPHSCILCCVKQKTTSLVRNVVEAVKVATKPAGNSSPFSTISASMFIYSYMSVSLFIVAQCGSAPIWPSTNSVSLTISSQFKASGNQRVKNERKGGVSQKYRRTNGTALYSW